MANLVDALVALAVAKVPVVVAAVPAVATNNEIIKYKRPRKISVFLFAYLPRKKESKTPNPPIKPSPKMSKPTGTLVD